MARDEIVEAALDRASERARNAPAPRVDTVADVAAREAAATRRAYARGREMNRGSPIQGKGTRDGGS